LKRTYRDRLRTRAPGLKFVFIEIDRPAAEKRVATRPSHLFPASLVASQFATLEPPTGEPGVIAVSAKQPLREEIRAVRAWLERDNGEAP
jgi:gluconokinase